MKKLYNIPTDDDLNNLVSFFNENMENLKKDDMYIVFELPKELLHQVDEHYYLKNNPDGDLSNFVYGDEVLIIKSGINFKFIVKNE